MITKEALDAYWANFPSPYEADTEDEEVATKHIESVLATLSLTPVEKPEAQKFVRQFTPSTGLFEWVPAEKPKAVETGEPVAWRAWGNKGAFLCTESAAKQYSRNGLRVQALYDAPPAPDDARARALEPRCTCRGGRDIDGSEFGPCQGCERRHDEDQASACLARDAARWRISQITYPRTMDTAQGYFAIKHNESLFSVGIQPHPVTGATIINQCTLGSGKTKGEAIDAMFLALNAMVDQGHALPAPLEAIRALALPQTAGDSK